MITDELIHHTETLRTLYAADNPVGLLLDELAKDLRASAARKEIAADAKAVMKALGPQATAHRLIKQILDTLKKKPRTQAKAK